MAVTTCRKPDTAGAAELENTSELDQWQAWEGRSSFFESCVTNFIFAAPHRT
jgi:hypothetical protein